MAQERAYKKEIDKYRQFDAKLYHNKYCKGYGKQYYKNNKDKIKKQKKIYYLKNTTKLLEYHKQYYKNNKDKIKKQKKIYYLKNKEKIKARSMTYYKNNNEKIKNKLLNLKVIKNEREKLAGQA